MTPERAAGRPSFSEWARHWTIDPESVFLNHGSFGACPRAVLETQQRWRERMERQPLRFLGREVEDLWEISRRELAAFIGAPAEDLAFVPNATAGVNTVLRSLALPGPASSGPAGGGAGGQAAFLRPGDELLVTDHEYNACRNALDYTAACTGARVVLAPIPFPVASPDDVLEALFERITPRTRLLLCDHITSPTAMILPMERIVQEFRRRGVDTLIDGAHAPGMIPLNLADLGATYYTGNCHKWLCAPKGAAFLCVQPERQDRIRPLAISHGANSTRTDRSRFQLEFVWTGTGDPTPYLCVGEAIRYLGSLLPGGWPELMRRNRELALQARELLGRILEIGLPCPPEMIGSMATLPLPDGIPGTILPPLFLDPLQQALDETYGIEVPIVPWPAPPQRWMRVSAQLYNSIEQYEYAGRAVKELLGRDSG